MPNDIVSRSVNRLVPANWQADGLSEFLDAAACNVIATFANKPTEFRLLNDVDVALTKFGKHLDHSSVHVIARLLILSTQPAYRTAAMIACAGSPSNMYPNARSVLEHAGYALVIQCDPPTGLVWLKRHDSPAALQACKKAFNPTTAKTAISSKDRGLTAVFDNLYNRTIDFGAHPNEQALMQNLSITKTDEETVYMKVQQLQGDGLALDHALRTLAQIGVFALHAIHHMMPERSELLGLREKIMDLRNHL